MDQIRSEECKCCKYFPPGSCSLELGRVDGGDGGAPPRLVADPVQGVLGRVPAVASQAETETSSNIVIRLGFKQFLTANVSALIMKSFNAALSINLDVFKLHKRVVCSVTVGVKQSLQYHSLHCQFSA